MPDDAVLHLISVDASSEAVVDVVAAVVEADDCFLLTRRPRGVHLAGLWEFPGGKVGSGETDSAALRREILEELGASVDIGNLVLETVHAYPERTVRLRFYRCSLRSEATPLLGQEMQWVHRAELARLGLPEADRDLVRLLTTPGTGPVR